MKAYQLWVDDSGTLRSNGYVYGTYSSEDKAKAAAKNLSETKYKNYYHTSWIVPIEIQ